VSDADPDDLRTTGSSRGFGPRRPKLPRNIPGTGSPPMVVRLVVSSPADYRKPTQLHSEADLVQGILDSLGCKSNAYIDLNVMECFHSIPKSFSGLGNRCYIEHRKVYDTLLLAGHISGRRGASEEVPENMGEAHDWEDESSPMSSDDDIVIQELDDPAPLSADGPSPLGGTLVCHEDIRKAVSEPPPAFDDTVKCPNNDIVRLPLGCNSLDDDWVFKNENPTGQNTFWFPPRLEEFLGRKSLPKAAMVSLLMYDAMRYTGIPWYSCPRFLREKYPKLFRIRPPAYIMQRPGIILPPPSTRGRPPIYQRI